MALSEFERQRQENIRRNQDLLRLLNLDSIHDDIKKEALVAPKRAKTTKRSTPKPKEAPEPTRRSRRLAGVKVENSEEYARLQREQDELERKRKQIDQLKLTRLYGEFSISDLLTTAKGQLANEEKIIGKVPDDGHVQLETNKVKLDPVDKELDPEEEDPLTTKALEILQGLGEKFSAADFYELIREKDINDSGDTTLEGQRAEFDKLSIHDKFDPLEIKIAHQRISLMVFHPAVNNRVIFAGDTVGDLGIWAVDDQLNSEAPNITIVKPHGKLVSKIIVPNHSPNQVFSASYDGSVRKLDLNKLDSQEIAYINDPFADGDVPLGVSDINLCGLSSPNLLYMTTLSGNFYQHDTRTKFKFKQLDLLRLHDKKIGSFSVNPNTSHLIATASLDRSLRIWDLRNVSQKNGSWLEYDSQISPFLNGTYESRLSVSCVDWNSNDRLVCNGYDDQICLFDLKGCEKWPKSHHISGTGTGANKKESGNLKPFNKIRHNCQTGRWVSILKSKWQPEPIDGVQKFAIANMNRGIDVYDQLGEVLAHLTGELVGAVPAVVSMHPSRNWVVGGSASGKVYLFD